MRLLGIIGLVVVSASLAVAVAVWPMALAVVLVPVAVVVASKPKLLVYVVSLVVLVTPTLQELVPRVPVTYADDAAVLFVFVYLTARRVVRGERIRGFPGLLWFGGFAALGLLSSIFREVPAEVALQGGFLAVKAVLFGFAVAQVDWLMSDVVGMVRGGGVVLVLAICCCVANVAVGSSWSLLLQKSDIIRYRYGLQPVLGPFIHPLVLGNFMALGAVALVAYRASVSRSRLTTVLLWSCVAMCLLSLRRTAAVGMSLGAVFIRYKQSRTSTLATMILAGPVLVAALWDFLQGLISVTYRDYVVEAGEAARTVLTLGSIDVARSYFPLGAGFGRFGSYLAGRIYSPEYRERGYQFIYGLGSRPGEGNFLSDTQWPAVIGETGFVGAAFFAVGLLCVWRTFSRSAASSEPNMRWISATGKGWMLVLLVASLGLPVFAGSPLLSTLFPLAAIASVLGSSRGRPDAEERETAPEPMRARA